MRSFRVSSCSPQERVTLSLIRLAAAGQAADGGPFAELAAWAHRQGLAILPGEAPYLSGGEVRLLAIIAGGQRRGDAGIGRMPRDLRPTILACAGELAVRSITLPYRAIQRSLFVERALAAGPAAKVGIS